MKSKNEKTYVKYGLARSCQSLNDEVLNFKIFVRKWKF